MSDLVHHALDGETRRDSPDPAIGTHRCLVRGDSVDISLVVRDVIGPVTFSDAWPESSPADIGHIGKAPLLALIVTRTPCTRPSSSTAAAIR